MSRQIVKIILNEMLIIIIDHSNANDCNSHLTPIIHQSTMNIVTINISMRMSFTNLHLPSSDHGLNHHHGCIKSIRTPWYLRMKPQLHWK